MPDGACAGCVVFVPAECLKPENCILSPAFCCIFLQAEVVMKRRKQGAQGDLPGSISWVLPG